MPSIQQMKDDYLASKGIHCPYCKSQNIAAGVFGNDSCEMWQKVVCDDCGKTWKDWYTLTGVTLEE